MNQEQEHRAKMLLCALQAAQQTIAHQRDVIGSASNLLGFMELDVYLEAERDATLHAIKRTCERILMQNT